MSHWYTSTGEPMHWVTGANGNQRDTTLRDARKLNLFPSVTGILDLIAKPALTNWLIDQNILAALTIPRVDGESDEKLCRRIKHDGREEGKAAAQVGTDIHDAIEKMWKGESVKPEDYGAIAHEAIHAIIDHTQEADFWTAETTVVGDGYGGKVDLHNEHYCIDYKTKNITDEVWEKSLTDKPPKLAYDEHCMQLSAYDKALGGWGRKLVNVFVDRTIPGRVIIKEWDVNMYDRFELLVKFWQLTKGYKPDDRE